MLYLEKFADKEVNVLGRVFTLVPMYEFEGENVNFVGYEVEEGGTRLGKIPTNKELSDAVLQEVIYNYLGRRTPKGKPEPVLSHLLAVGEEVLWKKDLVLGGKEIIRKGSRFRVKRVNPGSLILENCRGDVYEVGSSAARQYLSREARHAD